MASTSKTVNVTIYPTPYAVSGSKGSTGPEGPAGITGRGFFSLNFTGNVIVNYGTSTSVTVDVSSTVFKVNEKPNIIRRGLYKALGVKWEKK